MLETACLQAVRWMYEMRPRQRAGLLGFLGFGRLRIFRPLVQIVAFDVENAIPTGAIIFERDLPAQLH